MSGGDGYEPSYISVGGGRVCPPLQMARDFINGDASNLVELFRDSMFLADLENDSRDIQRLYPFGRSRKNVEILGTTGCDRYYDSGYGKGGISRK